MFDGFEFGCAARTVYGEARNQGADGMKAVAHVLLNRLKDGRWGKTMGGVCLFADKLASGITVQEFSCWMVGDPNRWPMLQLHSNDDLMAGATVAFGDAMAEQQNSIDPTSGATHYYADTIAAPAWADPAKGAIQTAHIGHHLFFRNVK